MLKYGGRGLDVVLYTHMCYFLICSKIAEIRDRVQVREGVDGVRKVPGDK